jgi:farnesyl-diphosphate farnesyltransferase
MPAAAPAPDPFPALLQGVSRSFYLSIRLLPGPLRQPVGLAYLLARATDTVADTAELAAGERTDMLATLASAFDGDPAAASQAGRVGSAFAARQQDEPERRLMLSLPACLDHLASLDAADRDDIRAVLRHITKGQALDVERFGTPGTCRALASAAELEAYTHLVAGSVGQFWTDLCFRHLGAFADQPPAEMRQLARRYGCGLQLVNILRDAGADLANGRCYFPATELADAGLTPAEAASDPRRLAPVWLRWHAPALERLEAGMRYADAVRSRRVRAASALPALIGFRTLARLREAGPHALVQRVKVPRGEVRMILLRLALTLAGRGSLRAAAAREAGEAAAGRWDNPPR